MLGLALDRRSRRSLSVQLAEQIRTRTIAGELAPGFRLPASRALAEELAVARGVVVEAYEQLEAEGYIESRRGIGAFIAAGALARRSGGGPPVRSAVEAEPLASERRGPRWDFTPGIPDLASFPYRAWTRFLADACAFGSSRDFSYGPSAGDRRLRAAISAYLYNLRGLRAEPERLFITAGTSAALRTLALFFRASRFFFEDPGLPFAREAFAAAGASTIPLAVGEEGAVPPEAGFARRSSPDLAYLTPSHQFPTGVLMPIRRRLEFVRAAEEAGALLVEDDYDAEFRFKGSPVPPIASIAPDATIYLGSFSKTLAPFLRVGWMVLPQRLVPAWLDFARRLNVRGSAPTQRALAFMLETGSYERHLSAMRRIYRRRRDALTAAVGKAFGDGLETGEGHTGFHLFARSRRPFGREAARMLRSAGVAVSFGGEFRSAAAGGERELVLGYGNIAEGAIAEGIGVLAKTLGVPAGP